MSLEQKIDLLTAAVTALTDAMKNGTVAAAAHATTAAATEEKPKGRGRPAGSTNKKPETTTTSNDAGDDDGLGLGDDGDDDGLGLGTTEVREVTEEELVSKFRELKSAKGKDPVVAILGKLGQSNVLTIPAEQRGKAIDMVEAALKAK